MNGAPKTVRLPVNLEERRFVGPLAKRLAANEEDPAVLVYWLGQAGFVFQAGGRRLLIDPYLSDTLADKYRGSATPHERMASPPIGLHGLGKVDLILATHHHTDHMDPGTLSPLAQAQPSLRFVVPRASRVEALNRIGASEIGSSYWTPAKHLSRGQAFRWRPSAPLTKRWSETRKAIIVSSAMGSCSGRRGGRTSR